MTEPLKSREQAGTWKTHSGREKLWPSLRGLHEKIESSLCDCVTQSLLRL